MPLLWECDGLQQCPGPEPKDESKCADTCKNDEFYCSFQKMCIPETWRCDSVDDCTSGEDESHCDCPMDSFKCHSGGCILASNVCDGHRHCPDFSDEWNCFTTNSTLESEDAVTDVMNDIVTIKNNAGIEMKVCDDHWNMYFSKLFCMKFGYNDAKSWSSVNISEISENADEEQYFKLRSGAMTFNLMKEGFDVTPFCDSGMVVAIKCNDNMKSAETTNIDDNKSVGLVYSDAGRHCAATIGKLTLVISVFAKYLTPFFSFLTLHSKCSMGIEYFFMYSW
jgi:hypothetical protein